MKMAALQGRYECRLVDHFAAGRVQEYRAAGKLGQLRRANHASRAGIQRNMHAQDLRKGQQGVQVGVKNDARYGARLITQGRIKSMHLHTQRLRDARHAAARELAAFLASAEALRVYERHGFVVLKGR